MSTPLEQVPQFTLLSLPLSLMFFGILRPTWGSWGNKPHKASQTVVQFCRRKMKQDVHRKGAPLITALTTNWVDEQPQQHKASPTKFACEAFQLLYLGYSTWHWYGKLERPPRGKYTLQQPFSSPLAGCSLGNNVLWVCGISSHL